MSVELFAPLSSTGNSTFIPSLFVVGLPIPGTRVAAVHLLTLFVSMLVPDTPNAARAGLEPAGPRVRTEGGTPAPTWHRAPTRHRAVSRQSDISAREGIHGCHNSGIPASSGVREPFFSFLYDWASTEFFQLEF